MSRRFLLVALFSFVVGLPGVLRAEEAAKASTPPAAECPHMKAMRESQKQGKGGQCPHMKDGKTCDCPAMKDGKEGGGCPHMKDGKTCDCPHDKADTATKSDKPGKQPAKASKSAGQKGAKEQ